MKSAAQYIQAKLGDLKPEYAVVLGSGLGAVTQALTDTIRIPLGDIEGFPQSAVSGHKGEIVVGKLNQRHVLMLSGRVHFYESGDAGAMRPIIEAFHELGIEKLFLTNAAGSVREDMPPGSVMQLSDHINFSGSNPLFGEPSDKRFVGLSNAYDADLAQEFSDAAKTADIEIHRGVYMWFSGPSFETPAEIHMARVIGADAVGMSTVPEVILARFYDMQVAAASIITNFAAGMTGDELSHTETKDMAPIGGAKLAKILQIMLGK